MLKLRTLQELKDWRAGLDPTTSVGFVPTMGALHQGHASLLRTSAQECQVSIASIFVNPLQFNEGSDFKRYPRTEDEDCQLLAEFGMDAVYLPTREDIYPDGYECRVRPGPGGELYEGYHRPGHFEGMMTVVLKLFQRVQPHRAYFGEKDAQQLWLVKRMAQDLDLNLLVCGCETVREKDGLALSSRNAFLTAQQRSESVIVCQALRATRELFRSGVHELPRLNQMLTQTLQKYEQTEIEYAEVIDDRTFRPAEGGNPGPWRALVAVRMGGTRLIDNLLLGTA
ncbi:MAG: pantoate--beta-alanine ligase [Planctomycetes bacterium]|nr:pantoate--beta-alanine ligase [Planctomycetota bacterium]